MQEMQNEVMDKLREAEMVLIGLGEEFDNLRCCKQLSGYEERRALLEASEESFWVPAYDDFCRRKQRDGISESLKRLAKLLENKNYFVVTTSTNDVLGQIDWKEGRFVAPCGGSSKKQCIHRCEEGLMPLTADEQEKIMERLQAFDRQMKSCQDRKEWKNVLGKCPKCGTPLILNNIYSEFYDENGYLKDWERYLRWVQTTMNRRLFVLELGVGLQCPSVIRFPFEKLVMYNNKASIYRVHESLYQMSEELQGKGTSISENSVDWLQILC